MSSRLGLWLSAHSSVSAYLVRDLLELLDVLAVPDIFSLTKDVDSFFLKSNTKVSFLGKINNVIEFLYESAEFFSASGRKATYHKSILVDIEFLS